MSRFMARAADMRAEITRVFKSLINSRYSGEDAGVVEELVGQHDDRVEPVVFQDPAADLALARPAVTVSNRRL
jgi:hypothetical protein